MSDSFIDLPVTGFSDQFVDETATGEKALRVKGEINVVTVPDDNVITINTYNEVAAVLTGVLTTVVTYTAPIGKSTFLQRATAGGTNIASYQIEINGVIIEKRRTYFSSPLTTDFTFLGFSESGLSLNQGDVVRIRAVHDRPDPGDFEANIQTIEVG